MLTNYKDIFVVLLVLISSMSFVSCVDEDDYENTASGNFEALWKVMDEHYCFFDEKKQELGVDWNEVHARYASMVKGTDTDQLFEVLARMIGELKDGHVNLYSGFDMGRNWSWKEDYPSNFSEEIYNKYIGTDYRISAGITYRILDDNIGYMRVASFGTEPGNGNLDEILYYFIACRSLIIDIRDNGGGLISAAEKLASRFVNEETLVGYMQHKTGKGHNDFSKREKQILKPSQNIRWQKPVFVLTNRGVFSAANEFTKYMKETPLATIIGDRTGGGAGMPFSSELPNGWGVRFSACPMYDAKGTSTENGIDPDISCTLDDADLAKGVDSLIEMARHLTR